MNLCERLLLKEIYISLFAKNMYFDILSITEFHKMLIRVFKIVYITISMNGKE